MEQSTEDSPLWGMKNVIVTAHYSGASPHYAERFLDIFLENLARYRSDQPLINVVDKMQYNQSVA